MELMIKCCLMNGYCPYNTTNEMYLICIIIVLVCTIIIDAIHK